MLYMSTTVQIPSEKLLHRPKIQTYFVPILAYFVLSYNLCMSIGYLEPLVKTCFQYSLTTG